MADQDSSFEVSQKASKFPPTLTSKPVELKSQACDQIANDSMSGYYQNVTQKAKLILPTAIWILIIVGGLSFLSLMMTLNKSVTTLENLVEIEKVKDAKLRSEMGALKREHSHRLAPIAEKLEQSGGNKGQQRPTDEDEDEERRGGGGGRLRDHEHHSLKSSWFSLPSWTSLEPRRSANRLDENPDEIPPAIKSLMDDLFQSPAFGGDSPMPASGSIVIASSADAKPEGNFGLIESMVKQVFNNNPLDSEMPSPQMDVRRPEEREESNVGSLVTANIDKLNININMKQEKEHHRKRKPAFIREEEERDKNAGLLDKSIDGLISKLMEPALQIEPVRPQTFLFPLGHPGPILNSEQAPTFKPVEPHHHHHHHRPGHRLPFGHPSNVMIPIPKPSHPQPLGLSDVPLLANELDRPISGGPRLPLQHDEGLPIISSPYEIMLPNLTPDEERKQSQPIEAPLGIMNQELASSLAQSLFGDFQPIGSIDGSPGKKDSAPIETVVMLNGKPLNDNKHGQIFDKNEDSDKKSNQVSELFNLFFGPPPNSKLVVAPQVVEPIIKPEKNLLKVSSSQEDDKANEKANSPPPPQQQPTVEEIKPTSPLFKIDTSTEEPTKIPESMIEEVINSMFALPQFSNEQQPIKVASQMSGQGEKGK